MQPLPGRMIAAQVQNPLQAKRVCSVLLTGDMPHCSKPQNQRLTSAMKNGTGCNRTLRPALSAMEQVSILQPSAFASAAGTDKTVRPPDVTQVIKAIAVGAESCLKFHQCPWVVFVHAAKTTPSNRWSQLHTPVCQSAHFMDFLFSSIRYSNLIHPTPVLFHILTYLWGSPDSPKRLPKQIL